MKVCLLEPINTSQVDKRRRLHFSKRIIQVHNTFSNESTIEVQKSHRKSQKFQEKHYLCTQQAFCNIHAEIPYHSIHCI